MNTPYANGYQPTKNIRAVAPHPQEPQKCGDVMKKPIKNESASAQPGKIRHGHTHHRQAPSKAWLLLFALLMISLLALSGCAKTETPVQLPSSQNSQSPGESQAPKAPESPESPSQGLPQPAAKVFVPAGEDEWRQYSFEPASIKTWINEEGDEILDVWVRIDFKNNPGTVVRDEQQWHMDLKNNRYKVSDTFSFDKDGNYCET